MSDTVSSLSPVLQIHIVTAVVALLLGPFVLWRKRRDRFHKLGGYVWVLAMGVTSVVSFFIPSHFTPMGVGPIHGLSVYALFGLWIAMQAVFQRNIALHKEVMQNLYVRGLCLAGAFNFLPGRTTQKALIPDTPELGYVIIAMVVLWAFSTQIRSLVLRLA